MDISIGWSLLDWLAHWSAASSGNKDDLLPSGTEKGEPKEASRDDVVLLVDDQLEVLDMAILLFEMLGYETRSASNATLALEMLKHDPSINILFTDVIMPDMNGVKLAKEALNIDSDLRVILVSGYTGSTLSELEEEVNNFPLLTKPYSIDKLTRLLTKGE